MLPGLMEQYDDIYKDMGQSGYIWFNDCFQTTILAGHREAVANGHNEIFLRLCRFNFNEQNISDLHRIRTNTAKYVLCLKVDIDKETYENRRMSPTNNESACYIKLDLSWCRKLHK
ncbi:hypothetical protein DPMN_152338 [Dreissena polymorpha]|uniref:Uncharacterized protein n=1 Tax=Dreissena polymorpha TaxID=45954 RepID=A0A9D4FLM3_DREPO|nr:hypothetical protein DPMN_152338 [Dreissena polymorpha]